MDRVGFIGLGIMGRPMASNLVRKGFPLVVYDINPAPLRQLEALGARAAASCAAVADDSDIVITMLPNSADVEEVLMGPGGVVARLRPGGAVMDMSTVDPLLTDRIAAAAAEKGIAFVDAPVGRLASSCRARRIAVHGRRDGRGVCAREAAARSDGHDDPSLRRRRYGHANQAREQLSRDHLVRLNAEALALSQRFGLSLEKTLDVVHGTTATNGQLKIAWAAKVLKGDTEPGFTIDLAHKDLTLIVDAATRVQGPDADRRRRARVVQCGASAGRGDEGFLRDG